MGTVQPEGHTGQHTAGLLILYVVYLKIGTFINIYQKLRFSGGCLEHLSQQQVSWLLGLFLLVWPCNLVKSTAS